MGESKKLICSNFLPALKKTMIRWAGLVCVFLLFFHCSSRDRSNPLDPNNPETHGRPTGLQITSDRHTVSLSWDKIDLPGITGYRIYKRTGDNPLFEDIGTATPNASAFTENIPYNQKTVYKISAQTSGYESPLSDSVAITAGPYNYWIADYYQGSVVHLTYDCLHQFSRFDYLLYPAAVTADSVNRSAYFVEEVFGYIWKALPDGTIALWQYGLSHPTDIEFDNTRRILWVCNNYRSEIVRFDMDQNNLGTTTGFGDITDICLSEKDGGCWVVDVENKSVIHISLYGQENVKIESGLAHPVAVDCYQADGSVWIADSLKLVISNSSGEIQNTIDTGRSMLTLSIDQSTGECWSAVVSEDQKMHEIWKIDSSGEKLVTIQGFAYIAALKANSSSGGCLVADAGNGSLIRISDQGEILGESLSFYTPWDIAIE
jgi:hypothetical protein